jgi:hypothetical protein
MGSDCEIFNPTSRRYQNEEISATVYCLPGTVAIRHWPVHTHSTCHPTSNFRKRATPYNTKDGKGSVRDAGYAALGAAVGSSNDDPAASRVSLRNVEPDLLVVMANSKERTNGGRLRYSRPCIAKGWFVPCALQLPVCMRGGPGRINSLDDSLCSTMHV